MACYFPLKGYRSRSVNASGKRSLVFKVTQALSPVAIEVPCGSCIGCRLERSRQWAIRCMHEASLYDANSFLTLTYDDLHMPSDGSLSVRDLQLFMKGIRNRFGKVRFYGCGEYGAERGRPHYHVLLFGLDFADKRFLKMSGENRLYTSEAVSQVWGKGWCILGEVSFESAAYVARYVMKKEYGPAAAALYDRLDGDTGEIVGLRPEFALMSRRPGIGRPWLDRFGPEVYRREGGSVLVRGRECLPPRYYDKVWEQKDPVMFEAVRFFRELDSMGFRIAHKGERSSARRIVKATVAEAQVKGSQRSYEK